MWLIYYLHYFQLYHSQLYAAVLLSFYLKTCEQQEVHESLNYTPELKHDAMSLMHGKVYEKSNIILDTKALERKFELLFASGEKYF